MPYKISRPENLLPYQISVECGGSGTGYGKYKSNIHSSPKVMAVFCFWFLKTFQSEECFQFWRQYHWVGVQHFHRIQSGAKWLTQCVPCSKCVTILFFKITFVLIDLLDWVKFIVFLWKFLHLEIDTPSPFLSCFMVIEAVVTKPWPVNSDCLWRLNDSISSRPP